MSIPVLGSWILRPSALEVEVERGVVGGGVGV